MSDSNRTQMYYLPEVSWGVTPASALTEMRFTSESLSYGVQTKSSDEIRSDRQLTDLILTGAEATGAINYELSYGTYDPFLAAALMATAWSTAVAISATDISAATTGNKYVAASTDFTTKNITPGQWVKVTGFVAANNNGFKRVVSRTVTDLVVEVQGAALVTETAPVAAVTIGGSTLRNGVAETSFTLERYHSDVTQFFTYRGMVPDTMDMKLAAGSIITGSFNFKGKDEVLAGTTKGTGTAVAASTTQIINAVSNVANVIEGSTLAAMSGVFVNSLDVSLKNNARGLTAIGSLGSVDMGYGRCDVTGNMKAYFINNTLYDKYINNTRSGLSYRMADVAGNAYIVTVPTIEFSSAKVNAGGGNQDVTVDIGWTALRDVTLGHTIQIDRFPIA
jgi:hypothetical protein